MKTILLLAYSISPARGSEYSVGWNYVKEMSRRHKLIVLYGLAGDHMGDIEEIAEAEDALRLPNVEFIPVLPNYFTNLLNKLNRAGVLIYTFYFSYRLWHRQAYKLATGIVESRHIDLIHYLCPIGYREPGYLWKLNRPYIWGPIGGVKNRPTGLFFQKSAIEGTKSLARNLINSLQFRLSRRVRAALQRADVVLSSTSETRQLLLDIHHRVTPVLPENAITTSQVLGRRRTVQVSPGETVNILWVGRIDENKSLDLLLAALAQLKSTCWHLYVVGDGPLRTKCERIAVFSNLGDKISWIGRIPRTHVAHYYEKSHLHVITSMSEANPTVIWEAMGFGVPTLSLDHCGMHDTLCDQCGIRVPISRLGEMGARLARELDDLISNPGRIEMLSHGVAKCAEVHSWTQRARVWSEYYELAMSTWQRRNNWAEETDERAYR